MDLQGPVRSRRVVLRGHIKFSRWTYRTYGTYRTYRTYSAQRPPCGTNPGWDLGTLGWTGGPHRHQRDALSEPAFR